MHMIPNVTVIYCLSELLLLLEIHIVLVYSFLIWTAWDVNVFLISLFTD